MTRPRLCSSHFSQHDLASSGFDSRPRLASPPPTPIVDLESSSPRLASPRLASLSPRLLASSPLRLHRELLCPELESHRSSQTKEVFLDTQPLIRPVLDEFNVCIFAYGQTGSGKTYTMSGPSASSREDWGVNYRALNDLFQIAQSRRTTVLYEVAVQMVEIYNEQVRDLRSSDGPQKRLEIWNTSQPNGLAMPDASMHPVNSTSDVLELMSIGLTNRAVGATALNEAADLIVF